MLRCKPCTCSLFDLGIALLDCRTTWGTALFKDYSCRTDWKARWKVAIKNQKQVAEQFYLISLSHRKTKTMIITFCWILWMYIGFFFSFIRNCFNEKPPRKLCFLLIGVHGHKTMIWEETAQNMELPEIIRPATNGVPTASEVNRVRSFENLN